MEDRQTDRHTHTHTHTQQQQPPQPKPASFVLNKEKPQLVPEDSSIQCTGDSMKAATKFDSWSRQGEELFFSSSQSAITVHARQCLSHLCVRSTHMSKIPCAPCNKRRPVMAGGLYTLPTCNCSRKKLLCNCSRI